jgi:hypothetical protein
MKRRFMLFIVVVASACNRTQPSAPSYVAPPVPFVTRHFGGVVLTEDGRPVPAATVSFPSRLASSNYLNGAVNATTDGNGSYLQAVDQPASWSGVIARATQTLYENTVVEVDFMPGQTEVTHNIRLYQSTNLAAGESAHLAITRDNSLCVDDDDELTFLCRAVHVTVPSSGTVMLDTIADDPSNMFWLSIGDSIQSPFQQVSHVSRSVDTATTVVVLVLGSLTRGNVAVTGGFTLKTAFAP